MDGEASGGGERGETGGGEDSWVGGSEEVGGAKGGEDSSVGGSREAGGRAEGGGTGGDVEWGSGRGTSGRVRKEIDSTAVEEGLEGGRG